MFPHHTSTVIKKAFASHDNNAKKCAEFLLKEKENGGLETSVEIEEWSDGDDNIRANNAAKKIAKEEKKFSDSDSDCNIKKRKLDSGNCLLVLPYQTDIS